MVIGRPERPSPPARSIPVMTIYRSPNPADLECPIFRFDNPSKTHGKTRSAAVAFLTVRFKKYPCSLNWCETHPFRQILLISLYNYRFRITYPKLTPKSVSIIKAERPRCVAALILAEFREHRFAATDNRNAGGYSLARCGEWAGVHDPETARALLSRGGPCRSGVVIRCASDCCLRHFTTWLEGGAAAPISIDGSALHYADQVTSLAAGRTGEEVFACLAPYDAWLADLEEIFACCSTVVALPKKSVGLL